MAQTSEEEFAHYLFYESIERIFAAFVIGLGLGLLVKMLNRS